MEIKLGSRIGKWSFCDQSHKIFAGGKVMAFCTSNEQKSTQIALLTGINHAGLTRITRLPDKDHFREVFASYNRQIGLGGSVLIRKLLVTKKPHYYSEASEKGEIQHRFSP